MKKVSTFSQYIVYAAASLLCGGHGLMAMDNDRPAAKRRRVAPLALKISASKFPTFASWADACKKLPHYSPGGSDQTPLNWNEVYGTLHKFACTQKKVLLERAWIKGASEGQEGVPPDDSLFDYDANWLRVIGKYGYSFAPFAQKLCIPPTAEVAVRGDLHGDIHSLIAQLERLQNKGYLDSADAFRITNPNFYMIFLGDYVDRGNHGIEVLYTLMRLKIANPDQIFFTRGNHEDYTVNTSVINGTFYREFIRKFSEEFFSESSIRTAFRKLTQIYDMLPVVLYLGSGSGKDESYIQCCHGGMEVGYDPSGLLTSSDECAYQWLGAMEQIKGFKRIADHMPIDADAKSDYTDLFYDFVPQSPQTPVSLGFMWHDFIVDSGQTALEVSVGRGLAYGKQFVDAFCKVNPHIKAVFRAHQHGGPMMEKLLIHNGLYRLWKSDEKQAFLPLDVGAVYTFMVAPDSSYGTHFDFNYDTFALLKVGKKFKDWKLERIINPDIFSIAGI